MAERNRLTDLVELCHRTLARVPADVLRQAAERGDDQVAAHVAMWTWGEKTVAKVPTACNVGALALAMRERRVAHLVRPAAARLVAETDLHTLPGEPPGILREAFIAQVRRPETGEVLFGDTIALGAYRVGADVVLVGWIYPADSMIVSRWSPHWGEFDIEAGLVAGLERREASEWLPDSVFAAHAEWTRDAARFALVFGLLLESEGAPLRVETECEAPTKAIAKNAGGAGKARPWTTRHVYLDEPQRPKARNDERAATSPLSEYQRVLEPVVVRGHLRRQVCGPGRSERRWIYVASHEARRWVAPLPMRVTVSARKGA